MLRTRRLARSLPPFPFRKFIPHSVYGLCCSRPRSAAVVCMGRSVLWIQGRDSSLLPSRSERTDRKENQGARRMERYKDQRPNHAGNHEAGQALHGSQRYEVLLPGVQLVSAEQREPKEQHRWFPAVPANERRARGGHRGVRRGGFYLRAHGRPLPSALRMPARWLRIAVANPFDKLNSGLTGAVA